MIPRCDNSHGPPFKCLFWGNTNNHGPVKAGFLFPASLSSWGLGGAQTRAHLSLFIQTQQRDVAAGFTTSTGRPGLGPHERCRPWAVRAKAIIDPAASGAPESRSRVPQSRGIVSGTVRDRLSQVLWLSPSPSTLATTDTKPRGRGGRKCPLDWLRAVCGQRRGDSASPPCLRGPWEGFRETEARTHRTHGEMLCFASSWLRLFLPRGRTSLDTACPPEGWGGEAVGGRAAGEEAREEEEGKHAYVTVGRFTVSAPWSR